MANRRNFRAYCEKPGTDERYFVYFRAGESIFSQHAVVELQQSTGLQDTNGREIFEGDVVEFTQCLFNVSPEKHPRKIKTVAFDPLSARFNVFETQAGERDFVVVGNRFTDKKEDYAAPPAQQTRNSCELPQEYPRQDVLQECLDAMAAMREQIEQMQGMFDDADGEIQAALDQCESAEEMAGKALAGNKTFHGCSVEDGADFVLAQISIEDIYYAGNPERGDSRGFSALHDRMDANMLLPFAEQIQADNQDMVDWMNAITDRVSEKIVRAWEVADLNRYVVEEDEETMGPR